MLAAPRHRCSAVRRFPPGCGRNPAERAHPHPQPPAPHPNPSAATLLQTNPSAACTVTKANPSPPGQLLPAAAAALPGIEGPDRGAVNGSVAEIKALAAAAALRPSAVRRYPPGCGRGSAVSKPGASVGEGEDGAGKPPAAACNGEAKAIAGDQKAVLREITLDHGVSNANGGGNSGGDGSGVQDKGAEIMAVPFLPWAWHGRRSQRRKL